MRPPDGRPPKREPKPEAKLFATEAIAKQYLKDTVPPIEDVKELDLSFLDEQLFNIPEDLAPGHHEFEGKNGYRVSFDLISKRSAVHRAAIVYKGLIHPKDGEAEVEGDFKAVYGITNLVIETPNFSFNNDEERGRKNDITWIPGIHSKDPELNHNFAHVDRGQIYLIDEVGFFAKPRNLISLFHELGHIETRTPQELVDERNSIRTEYSVDGIKTEPFKSAALELQRERDANKWMVQRTRSLFEDLSIPPEFIDDYVQHVQLESYHDMNRWRLSDEYDAASISHG